MDNVLTVEDVAKLLKVKPITVREMLRTQRIRGFKVGKAWRTTEAMLAENLATIAQGEKPEPLEAQRVLAAQPKRKRVGRRAATAQVTTSTAKAAPAKRTAHNTQDEEPAAPRAARRGSKSTDKPEENQQLLF